MTRYILTRLVKSVLSILIVVSLVVGIVYKLVPTSRIFLQDDAYKKMKGNPKIIYMYGKMENLGYLDFLTQAEMCAAKSGKSGCSESGSEEQKRVAEEVKKDGYTVEVLDEPGEGRGTMIAYKKYSVFQLVGRFFRNLIVVDHKNFIQDPKNPNLERGYRIEKGPNGIPAVACSGCKHKYQLYIDGNFPFIHQNKFKLNFGESFPSNQGVATLDVIGVGQGPLVNKEQTFPTGEVLKSPINQYTLKYKSEIDHLDQKRFNDHYASGESMHENPSMITTSYIFGISSVILAYAIAIPAAVAMARNKDGLIDNIGIGYINLTISLPSLAFIFFIKYIGVSLGLPDKFPHLGFGNPVSYILPIIIMGLLSTPSIMLWVRRYMVDQENADYVKFAKAKGLSKKEISRRHILKNAIIPIVNGLPTSIIMAISGAVLTETVFAIPGMGKMLPDAIQASNNNMVITLTFIFTSLAVIAVFLGDLLMTVVDPRISLNVKKGE